MKVAVVGHVEWAEVIRIDELPPAGGWIEASDLRVEVAGAGATAARQLAKLAGRCALFTTLAGDDRGRAVPECLSADGVEVHATFREGVVQRRAFVHVDRRAERTITVHGPKLCPSADDELPWSTLATYDGVCFVCGDEGALDASRQARVLVATARWLTVLEGAGVQLDALVGSDDDPNERYRPGDLQPPPGLVVMTDGADGGTYTVEGEPAQRYAPAPLEGPPVDSYGCGDSFLAGLTYGLVRGDPPEQAVELAARCGSACLTGPGLDRQLQLAGGGAA